jgi:hypothetical protein
MRAALGDIASARDGQQLVELYEVLGKAVLIAKLAV